MADGTGYEPLRFMKMHGAGNDFVVIDTRGRSPVSGALARALGDRHRGVGFDQIAEIQPGTDGADVGLKFWNPDGSTSGACGNATRCVADHLMGQSGKDEIKIRTERGLLQAAREEGRLRVNMGQPQLHWADIPLAEDVDVDHLPIEGDPAAVGMGNPHCVFFVADVASVDVAARGATMEHHPLYPNATNVEFAEVRKPNEIRMRVWERGTGITLACASGTCATVVAAHRRGLTDREVDVEADGGWLSVQIRDDGVWMSGPTAHVFDGELSLEFLKDLT